MSRTDLDPRDAADAIRDAFIATGEADAKSEYDNLAGADRVTFGRQLARGRWQVMGEVLVHDDGDVEMLLDRRRAWAERIIVDAIS